MAVRVIRHGSGRFAIDVQSDAGRVRLMNAPPKGGDYGRHGALGALDDVGEQLKRFVLGEVRKGDVEIEGKKG